MNKVKIKPNKDNAV